MTKPAAEEPITDAERAIDAAITAIGKLTSVAADVEQEVDILNQKFKLVGRYLKAPKTRYYLNLKVVGLTDSVGSFLQVCDGETLWEYQLILDAPFYRKLQIQPILDRLNSPDLEPEVRTKAYTQMGLSGPETLLIELRKVIRFDIKEEAELDGIKVWRLHGTWKNRQSLVGPDSRPVNPIGPLPPYVPMDAILYLGIENRWPYQLRLQGRPTTALADFRPVGPDGRPRGAKSSIEKIPQTFIILTYKNVKLNANIRVDEFAFTPPANATIDDGTEATQKLLDRALEAAADKKKRDAQAKEGPVLDQPLDVPPSSPELTKPKG
jgi:outer membrane lipoprotein-sorting protein